MPRKSGSTRRDFIKTAGAAIAVPYVITSAALGNQDRPAASDRIVMGGIGIGNMGSGDQNAFLGRGDVQYVAVCDVRKGVREKAKGKVDGKYGNKDCTAYNDFRELLGSRRHRRRAYRHARPLARDHGHRGLPQRQRRLLPEARDAHASRRPADGRRRPALCPRRLRRQPAGAAKIIAAWSNKCWGGEIGKIKSINVNVGPLSQPCNLPAEEVPADIDWELWLGPAPWAPYNAARCSGNFSTTGNSWRSYIDYSGGGMTDWGAHHFGGATFAVDVRELQPEEVVFHDDNGKQWLESKYARCSQRRYALVITHNKPGKGNLEVEGTPAKSARPSRCRFTRAAAASTATSSNA